MKKLPSESMVMDAMKIRQSNHFADVVDRNVNWGLCIHYCCRQCHGTYIKLNGRICKHTMPCCCNKCRTPETLKLPQRIWSRVERLLGVTR